MSFESPYGKPDSVAGNINAPNPQVAPAPNYGGQARVPAHSTMSIVGFILSILFPLVGLIISIVAIKQAGETGDKKGLAKAGIIVGAVLFVLNIIFSIALYSSGMAFLDMGASL